ncbi:MAG: hypothetical protein FWG29_10195 [Treponema sp.]|nr:hypothetical protein [Treponema sp.]
MKLKINGIIENIKAYSARGDAGKELKEARLIENSGLDGDFHATGGDRQLSLLIAETKDQIKEQTEKGLCLLRFKENITIRGIDPKMLHPGVQLVIGEATLTITGETKRCFKECPLFETGKRCPLAGLSLFAKVVKSGVICVGDKIIAGIM